MLQKKNVVLLQSKLWKNPKKVTSTIRWNRSQNWALISTSNLLDYNSLGHFFTIELKITKFNNDQPLISTSLPSGILKTDFCTQIDFEECFISYDDFSIIPTCPDEAKLNHDIMDPQFGVSNHLPKILNYCYFLFKFRILQELLFYSF